jgi:DNA polymerase III epsilon subunit
MTRKIVLDKPRFREIASEFIEYIRGAELIIHNAPFDVEFLEQELALAKLPPLAQHCAGVKDTLKLAKELHPGKKNSLDALCERYGVNNTHRTLHGALLDAELLAEVYLAMTRGQESLMMELEQAPAATASAGGVPVERVSLPVLAANEEETAEHAKVLQDIQVLDLRTASYCTENEGTLLGDHWFQSSPVSIITHCEQCIQPRLKVFVVFLGENLARKLRQFSSHNFLLAKIQHVLVRSQCINVGHERWRFTRR